MTDWGLARPLVPWLGLARLNTACLSVAGSAAAEADAYMYAGAGAGADVDACSYKLTLAPLSCIGPWMIRRPMKQLQ